MSGRAEGQCSGVSDPLAGRSGLGLLEGLRVLELGHSVPAAAAGTMLRQFGASVTRLRSRLDGPGATAPRPTERGRLLEILGECKDEAVVGDPWGEEALALASEADITIADVESLLDGCGEERLQAYEESVRRANRGVWVTISPFGLAGPLRGARGGDLVTLAAGGIASYMRTSDGRPMKPAGFSSSIPAGEFAALAGLHGALRRRDRPEPVHLDLSIQDSVLVTGVFLECSHVIFECSREGGSASYAAPVGLIRCEDGLVWITVLEQHHWEGCVRALDSPAWATAIVTSEARYAESQAIRSRMDEWAGSLTARACADRLQAEGVPATVVNTCTDLLEGAGVDVSEGFFVPTAAGGSERRPGIPVRPSARHSRQGSAGRAPGRRDRVLDVSQVLVAPLATAWLAAMGVDVLKVEDLGRTDVYRRVGPFIQGNANPECSAYFSFVNYSKRSHAVDLESPGGRSRLSELVASADVVVTNLSRSRARRLGLDIGSLVGPDAPSLIECAGFGSTTEHASYRAYGLNIQAAGGAVHLSSDRAGIPRNFGTSWADPLASIWIAAVAAAQLLAPAGRRGHAEVSMVEVIAWQFPEYFAAISLGEPDRTADENRLDHAAPHGIYRCSGDDAWLAVAVETDGEWRGLLDALGQPAELADPRFAGLDGRLAHEDELDGALGAVLVGRHRDELFDLLGAAGVACAPVWSAPELVRHPHLLERGILRPVNHPVWGERLLAGVPWRVVGEGTIPIDAPPLLGEHTTDDPARWWR